MTVRALLCLGLLSVCGCVPRLPQAIGPDDQAVNSPDGRIVVEFRRYVALARRSGGHWWTAGINGVDTEHELTLDLREVAGGRTRVLITEGEDAPRFRRQEVQVPATGELRVVLTARGGFVARSPYPA